MDRCDSCLHWHEYPEINRNHTSDRLGWCSKLIRGEDWNEERKRYERKPDTIAFVPIYRPDQYIGNVFECTPEFGCVLHKPLIKASSESPSPLSTEADQPE